MPDPDYEWPKYPTGPKDHLHALGVISLNFSHYEAALIIFFERYIDKRFSGFIFDKMNNEERAGAIRELISIHESNRKFRKKIDFMLRHFATCAENRHTLLHAKPRVSIMPSDILMIEKAIRGTPGRIIEL